jgi:hypothetical protein
MTNKQTNKQTEGEAPWLHVLAYLVSHAIAKAFRMIAILPPVPPWSPNKTKELIFREITPRRVIMRLPRRAEAPRASNRGFASVHGGESYVIGDYHDT